MTCSDGDYIAPCCQLLGNYFTVLWAFRTHAVWVDSLFWSCPSAPLWSWLAGRSGVKLFKLKWAQPCDTCQTGVTQTGALIIEWSIELMLTGVCVCVCVFRRNQHLLILSAIGLSYLIVVAMQGSPTGEAFTGRWSLHGYHNQVG